MLAFETDMAPAYDVTLTAISALPAILASALALHLMATRRRGHAAYLMGGAFVGIGIGLMHYTGMAAMLMHKPVYHSGLFVLSLLVAIVLGVVSLYAQDLSRGTLVRWLGVRIRWVGAAIMGAAIAGMHYVGMAAAEMAPGDGHAHSGAVDGDVLAFGVATVSALLAVLAISAALINKKFQMAALVAQVTQKRLMEAIESISDGFVLFDAEGRLILCNSVFRQMYPSMAEVLQPGVSYAEILRSWVRVRGTFADPDQAEAYIQERLRRFYANAASDELPEEEKLEDGRWMYVRQRSVGTGGLVGVWTDVTPIKELQSLYERQASHDALTGLPNRMLFQDRLKRAASRAKRMGSALALLYIDLDGFKPVNDTLGHNGGDVVLREVAVRLKRAVREVDTVARLGGDEFAIIIEPQAQDQNVAAVAAERILSALRLPIRVGSADCQIGASIGIGISKLISASLDDLIQTADAAMYQAKKAGGNRTVIKDDGDAAQLQA
jgi:diguanylate cyclase (GGDEF)-like protein